MANLTPEQPKNLLKGVLQHGQQTRTPLRLTIPIIIFISNVHKSVSAIAVQSDNLFDLIAAVIALRGLE